MNLVLDNISAGYNGRKVVHGICATFQTGEITCLLGPNGCGKTTLFKAILGLLPSSGKILIDNKLISGLSRKERARIVAYVPQIHIPPFPFTVSDVVLTGRTPFTNSFSPPCEKDRQEVVKAMELLGIEKLGNRNYAQLSGGERQLVLIARALAQSPKFLIMDEPTSHLDFGNQLRTIKLISQLAGNNMGIILTTHVPDHAFMCATNVAALYNGNIIAHGKPSVILTCEVLRKMYGIDVDIVQLSGGRCLCAPSYGG